MISEILFGIGMFAVTLLIQYGLFKKGKAGSFWIGRSEVVVLCVLGLLSNEAAAYLVGILGYVIGDFIGEKAGWHKNPADNE